MKTIFAALLACLLIGNSDAQQRQPQKGITVAQYMEICKEYGDWAARQYKEGKCTQKQYADYLIKVPDYVIEDHGPIVRPTPPRQRSLTHFRHMTPVEIQLEGIADQLGDLRRSSTD